MSRGQRLMSSIYEGCREGGVAVVKANQTPIDLCNWVRNHSPTGAEWGYHGSGPAQAALAIMVHHLKHFVGMTNKQAVGKARKSYQTFKRCVIACLPELWVMESRAIEEFRTMVFREDGGQPVDWNLWRASAFERGVILASKGNPVIRA